MLGLFVVYLPLSTVQAAVSPAVDLIQLMELIIPTMISLTVLDYVADLLNLIKSGWFSR